MVLVDAAWGDDPPATAERTLLSHITRLREALAKADSAAPPRVERYGGGYRLVVAPEAVDATWFEQTLLGVKDLPSALICRDPCSSCCASPPDCSAGLVESAWGARRTLIQSDHVKHQPKPKCQPSTPGPDLRTYVALRTPGPDSLRHARRNRQRAQFAGPTVCRRGLARLNPALRKRCGRRYSGSGR